MEATQKKWLLTYILPAEVPKAMVVQMAMLMVMQIYVSGEINFATGNALTGVLLCRNCTESC